MDPFARTWLGFSTTDADDLTHCIAKAEILQELNAEKCKKAGRTFMFARRYRFCRFPLFFLEIPRLFELAYFILAVFALEYVI